MSWSSFEDFKKFAKKNEPKPKKKRPLGSENPFSGKRRRTASESVTFVSACEDGHIQGFSSEEEGDPLISNLKAEIKVQSLNQPIVKREYKRHERWSWKDNIKPRDNDNCWSQIQDDVYELSKQVSKETAEDEIAIDEDDIDDINHDGKGIPLLSLVEDRTTKHQDFDSNVESISDFQSDEERSSSQNCSSATISTPTPTPLSPGVVGTPKTTSEWLKHVQKRSPQEGGEAVSVEDRIAVLQHDSAKKKRKFMRAGLAEHLQRIISREKSEKTFWNHRLTDIEKGQSSEGVSLQDSSCLVVQILSDLPQFSLHLTQCCLLCEDNDSPTDPSRNLVEVLFTNETWKQIALRIGATVKIHPPWQKLAVPGSPRPVVLCTYFCERQQALPGSPVVDLTSLIDYRGLIPRQNASRSSATLVRSPRKGFKPSKLLFGTNDETDKKQTRPASSTLATVQPSSDIASKPNGSLLGALQSCGGYGGAVVSFKAAVQRVYFKSIRYLGQGQADSGCTSLTQTLKSNARTFKKAEEIRWILFVQDVHGVFAEIQVPSAFQHSSSWYSCLATGEGKMFSFSQVQVLNRTNSTRSPRLFSMIHSLWSRSEVAQTPDSSSQINTQESDTEVSKAMSPPDFSYILTLQGSSQVTLCQDTDGGDMNLSKPAKFISLRDLVPSNTNTSRRFSTRCKLLCCRFDESPKSLPGSRVPTFELFVTDSSMQMTGEPSQRSTILPYERIVGQSSFVMFPQLKSVLNYPGTVLCLTDVRYGDEGQKQIDTYSLMRKAVPDSREIPPCSLLYESPVPTEVFDRLTFLQASSLPTLTSQSRTGYLYMVEGQVTGVNEETACCWLVCNSCGDPNITPNQATGSQFFCSLCNADIVSPQTRTHLEVELRVKSCPNNRATVRLLQHTIGKLLPVSYQDTEQEYDIEAVLGKPLGPMACYVTKKALKDDGIQSTYSFNLEEIHTCS